MKISSLIAFMVIQLFSHAQRFAVISDIQGVSSATMAVSHLVANWNPDLVITSGDNYYSLTDDIDTSVGQFYHQFMFPYTGNFGLGDTANRFFPVPGNHDWENGLSTYLNYFTLPGNERYYHFVKGDVHFFAVDSDTLEPDGTSTFSAQATWLHHKLATSVSRWNIVYFHHSPYSSGYHGSQTYMQWPFRQWGATAVFSGHDHDYERLNVDTLTYFVNGTGGGGLYTVYNPVPGSQVHYLGIHGAILVEATHDSIVFQFKDTTNALIDRYSIVYGVTGINHAKLTDKPVLYQNYPNPASGSSTISYYLPSPSSIKINIYNILGKNVSTLVSGYGNEGLHEIQWASDCLENGIYYYSLECGGSTTYMRAVIDH